MPTSAGSRELVLQAIERRRPPRLPICYCNRDFDQGDALIFPYGKAADFQETEPGLTEWGYVWKKVDATMGQPCKEPLLDWDRLAVFRPPDPMASGRMAPIAPLLRRYPGKFMVMDMGITGSNAAMFLRGFENFIMDLTTDRRRARAGARHRVCLRERPGQALRRPRR